MPEVNEWLTADEMCEVLGGISRRTLRRRVSDGEIEKRGENRSTRYRCPDLGQTPANSGQNDGDGRSDLGQTPANSGQNDGDGRSDLGQTPANSGQNDGDGRSDSLSKARATIEEVITDLAEDITRPFDDDALQAATELREHNDGVFQKLKAAIKNSDVDLNDYKRRLKQYAAELRAKEVRERIEKLADKDIPHFHRADQAEVAEKLCEVFIRRSGEPPAYEFGELFSYDPEDGLWKDVSHAKLSTIIQGWAGRALVGDPAKDDPKVFHCNGVKTAIELAYDRPVMWGQGEGWLANAPKGIGFSDCFLRAAMDKGGWKLEINPKGPENRARFGFDFPIKRQPDCPKFDRFISQLFAGAEDVKQRQWAVQEHVAASLFGVAPRFTKALIMYGPGGCGKSTLLEILAAAFPEGSVTAVQPHDWGDDTSLSLLAKSRVNMVNEISARDMMDTNAVKAVIVGDAIKAEPKYKNPFTFRPDAGHIFTANEDRLPSVPDADPPFWDRWHIVPFENKFRDTDAEDRTLAATIIEEELHGVLAWIIEGAKRLFEQGKYTSCPSGEEIFKDWQGTANSVSLFYQECTTELMAVDSKRELPLITDLYEAYKFWAKNGGYRACSRRTFSQRTNAVGLYDRSNGSRARCRLLPEFKRSFEEAQYKSGRLV